MKLFIICSLLMCFVAFAMAAPHSSEGDSSESGSESGSSEEDDEPVGLEDIEDNFVNNVSSDEHNRRKRATCDLLSFTGANHAFCAGHCILQRHKGGYCDSKGVCNCRN